MKNRFLNFAVIFLAILISVPFSAMAQEKENFKKEHFIKEGDTLKYRILFPQDFSEGKEYPLVLFLHGAGERGNDNEAQLIHGSKLFLEKSKDFPAIVIFPQAPKDDYWAKVEVERDSIPYRFNFKNLGEPTNSLHMLMAFLDTFISEKYVDRNRIYVGGLSMGGMGTFELLSRKPDLFAAAFAICGGADTAIVKNYPAGFNIWIFHGEKDNVVLPEYSKTMAREINSKGGNAKLSLYPDDDHNSWDSALAEPHLLPWLFSHERSE